MAYRPSRVQLIFLDCVIVFLSLLITTLAYETSYTLASPSFGTLPGANTDLITATATAAGIDPLQPLPAHSRPATPPDPALAPCAAAVVAATALAGTGAEALVVDVRLAAVTRHLRDPPPPPPPERAAGGALLPLPNTAGWPLSESLRMLMRARNAGARGAAAALGGEQGGQEQGQGQGRGQGQGQRQEGAGDGSRRLPGSIDPDDGG
ncbi:hypothetical protein HETIRDRAFT_169473 [Heterobasidion irregulare TC 32-1]|uniref:Uncharacterized protein n=1 Tax=Heterobasidion irregulare (strain TC 32-1) TaxID=747525 RepID=W4K5V4_HETIT|nr:uncharacterized protein HETIRDRAFT_169473 [Heterobasidion irregulare TC 32-1]ETW80730.1 hypothetical protein HETIRDRAFT_169473 [Heterobasidion irregulare TC 32-1]